MAGRLQDRVAVITGGASGIGRGCAVRFAEEGAHIVVADLKPDGGRETVEQVRALGRQARFVQVDTSREEDCEALAREAADAFGRIDAVVAAAGISHAHYVSGEEQEGDEMRRESSFVLNKPVADWEKVLAVNLTGVMLTDRALIKRMIELGGRGSVVNIASGAAKIPIPGAADYCVSKAGVWMLTKTLALEVGRHGIRVNAIGPGLIDTPMTSAIQKSEGRAERIVGSVPLARIGKPLDIANTALFLASDESDFFTGQILHPDGGIFTG